MNESMNDNHRNMLVMKASAGSGKTYNLAQQYIKHLLFARDETGKLHPRRAKGDDRILNAHRLLLAITFTNKATDEMKDRIVKELYRLSQPGIKSDYLEGFIGETGLEEQQVRALAHQALNELLFDYSNFNVSTIDSFFQSILRNFARELDCDFNYDIQLEEDYAVRVAVHNFLLSLGRPGKPTQIDQWVKEYQRHLLHGRDSKKQWRFFDDAGTLTDFAKQINTEAFRSRIEDIRRYLGSTDDNGVFHSDFTTIRAFKKFVSQAQQACEDSLAAVTEELYRLLTPFSEGLNGKQSFAAWLKKEAQAPMSDTLLGADRDKICKQFKKGGLPDDSTIDNMLRLVTAYFKYKLSADFLSHINDNLGMLGMLAMIDIFLEEFRHETNSILIGDTNQLIGTVLDSGSEFVYERVGTTIAHFMIDEFQDTSTKQYENFRGLLRESLAGGNFNMLIGDAKQSIYRFRNADPTVFRERVDADFSDDIYRPAVEPGAPTSVNYRSSENIIRFNNDLFKAMLGEYRNTPTVSETYADVEQGLPANIRDKVPGYVRLMLGGYGQLLGSEQTGVSVYDILPDYLLKLHERFDWGQIGILVNTNAIGTKVVECVLEHNKHASPDQKISIISGESLLLNNSSIIRRIIAMLRFIDVSRFGKNDEDEDDGPEAANDIQQRIRRKRESDQRLYAALSAFIHEISGDTSGDPRVIGEKLDACLNALSVANTASQEEGSQGQFSYQEMLGDMLPPPGELTTLVSIVETIVAAFKRDEVGGSDVDAETAFLLAFQDTVMKFSAQRNGGSVREFLKYWDEKKGVLAVSSADGGDAVNIMTIHKAKGLEFDCVIIPEATWNLTNNSREDTYWMPREVFADALRSLPIQQDEWNMECLPPLVNVSKKAAVALNTCGMLVGEARTFVRKQQADVLIDNLNKTYVAFTRPRTELHILSAAPTKDWKPDRPLEDREPAKNLTQLMSLLAPIVMNPAPGIQGPLPSCYEYGSQSSRDDIQSRRHHETSESQRVNVTQYPVMPLPTDLCVKVENASSSRIKSGLRLHSLMSRIHDRDDVDHVIAWGLKHGIITQDPDDICGIQRINANIRGPIMDPSSPVAAWFDPANHVYSERTITSAVDPEKKKTNAQMQGKKRVNEADGIENLRPDRIVRRPDGTILVIDYKSGRRNDEDNLPQLQEYVNQLRAIFPGTPIAGRLWYTTRHLILDEHGHPLSKTTGN